MSEKGSIELSFNYYQYLVENLPQGIWVEDDKGNIIFANKQIAKLAGNRMPLELIGKTWHELILPNEIKWIEEYLRSSKQQTTSLETLLKTPNGPISVELHIFPLKDGEKAIGKVFLVSPIEKEKKSDPPTKMQPDQWQEIIENSIDGICILENHRLRFVNRRMEEITGYSAAELKSIGFENIIAHHDRKKIEKIIHSPQTVIMPLHHAVKIITKLKREIDTELRVVPMRHDEGKNLICFFRDITQIKELEHMKTDFITMVSHELRTPLTAIKEAVSLLSTAMASKSPEVPVRFINIAKQEIGRLHRMIDNLVEVSRIESGKLKMKLESIKIPLLIDTAVESLEVLSEKKKIKVVKNIPKNLPSTMGDNDRIFHLFSNILDNAIKFTPKGGTVTITAEKVHRNAPIVKAKRLPAQDDYIMITISDTGPGIAPQNQTRIFEKFERIEPTRGAGVTGIGLGLTIARNTVELHKGKIWVTSVLGKGSTFSFLLPTNLKPS